MTYKTSSRKPLSFIKARATLVITAFLAAILAVVSLAGCQLGTRTYQDGLGRTLSLKGTPKRIVSLSPALTENVFALGLGDRLVGVTAYCNRPPEAQKIEKVGDAFNVNLEKIVALKPDLVLCAGTKDFQAQYVKDMERLGIPTYVSGPSTVKEVLADLENLARVLGVEKKGRELVQKLQKEIDEISSSIKDSGKRPRVFVVLDKDLWTVGPGSFIDDVISIAGGQNVVKDVKQQYLQISMEELLAKNPDVILVTIPKEEARALESRPGWSSLKAVQEGRVYYPNPDLVSRPSVAVVEGIKEIASWLRK